MTHLLLVLLAVASPTPPSGCAERTGSSATLLLPARPALERAGTRIMPGDEISVLTPDGLCAGTGRWEGNGMAVSLWADDPTTAEADGLRRGEPVRLVVRDGSTGTLYEASDVDITYDESFGVDGGYDPNGLYAVAEAPEEEPTPSAPAPAPPSPAPAPPTDPEQVERPVVFAINEVEADQGATDTAEFVEIRSSRSGASLAGHMLVLADASGAVYASAALDTLATRGDGLLVLRPSGPHGASLGAESISMSSVGEIRDETGVVALYKGAPADFPVGSEAGVDGLVDAVVFGPGGAGRSGDLLSQFGQTVQYVETDSTSLQRLDVTDYQALAGPDAFVSALLHPRDATAGVVNGRQVTVDRTRRVQDAAGFRLVSVPVMGVDGRPKAVGDVAAVNLVRGVAGGDRPAQYPAAAPNVFVSFDDGSYLTPSTTDTALPPGDGFFWHWFDEDAPPSDAHGGGTSRGHDLGSEAFALATTGVPVDDTLLDGPYGRTLGAPTGQGVHLVGNPYPYPLRLSGVTVEGGTLQSAVAVWDPVRGTFEDLFADLGDAVLPVWGGAVIEVDAPQGSFEVVTTSDAVDPTAVVPVETRARRQSGATRLSFEVTGTLAGGQDVADASAHVRFVEDAVEGWDRHDGSKLTPPTESFALVAPVGTQEGEARRHRVLSLPTALPAPRAVPLAFASSEGGAFTLRWDLSTIPANWDVRLDDLVEGTSVDLRDRAEYAFETTDASAWLERFEIVMAPVSTPNESLAGGETTVSPAYPNPAVGRVRLDVRAATSQRVAADVYDALGRRVVRAFEGSVSAGTPATVAVDTDAFAPGLYVVRVEGETFQETRRVVVTR